MDQNPQVDTSFHLEQCDYTQPWVLHLQKKKCYHVIETPSQPITLTLTPFPQACHNILHDILSREQKRFSKWEGLRFSWNNLRLAWFIVCISVPFLLTIVLYAILRITASGYPFGIFKHLWKESLNSDRQWFPPISTKRIITSHLNSLNIKKYHELYIGNLVTGTKIFSKRAICCIFTFLIYSSLKILGRQ